MHSNRPLVVISPYKGEIYNYVSIIDDVVTSMGLSTVPLRLAMRTAPPFKNVRAVLLNWFDEVNLSSRPKATLAVLGKTMLLRYWRLRKIKILFTVHNRLGHNHPNADATDYLRIKCCDYADAIVILSDETREVLQSLDARRYEMNWEHKIKLIKHPSFVPYGTEPFAYPKHQQRELFRFLFVGTVNRYKNIDLILDVAEEFHARRLPAEFIVVGSSADELYLKEIAKRARILPNVTFRNERPTDEALTCMIEESDILILPYDRKSSINSGTCVLAFSHGRNVICPIIGTIEEYPSGLTFAYGDDYQTQEERYSALLEQALRAYDMYTIDRGRFEWNERELQRITNLEYSQENTAVAYESLLGDS